MIYDLIIVGAGPAGFSAAIYGIRKKINLLLISDTIGGQATEAHIVNNYLGIPEIFGTDLVEKFYHHAKSLGVPIKEGVKLERVQSMDNGFELITTNGKFDARSIIIASGKKYRELEVPGAKEFTGKGIVYCATCDAPLFKDRIVAVIGGGDAGQDAAWQLTKYASKIYLLNRYTELRGDNVSAQEQIIHSPKIEVINQSFPVEIKGSKFVETLVYQQNGSSEKHEINVSGVFVEIGSVPASELLKSLVKLNEKGEIIIDPQTNMTSTAGIFAAGDVTNLPEKQMIIAAGEGAKAALAVYEYLKSK